MEHRIQDYSNKHPAPKNSEQSKSHVLWFLPYSGNGSIAGLLRGSGLDFLELIKPVEQNIIKHVWNA